MKPRPTQFDVRENTASSRQHASRLAERPTDFISHRTSRESHGNVPSFPEATFPDEIFARPLIESANGATEAEKRDENRLLTVHAVANLLQVPVSWVYEHTRQRCTDRIPGFRLGKYWRFSEADVIEWLAAKRKNNYHHA
jgi:excisionase family DNA binding protein